MNLQVIKNRIGKILAYTVAGLLIFFLVSFLTLQLPPVQKSIIQRFLNRVNSVAGFPSKVDHIHLFWFDRLVIDRFAMNDPEGNKIISFKKLLVNFDLLKLIRNNEVVIDGVFLDSAHVYLTKIQEDDTSSNLNMNVLINRLSAPQSDSSGGKNPPKIQIGEVRVQTSILTYNMQDREPQPNLFDYNHFRVFVDEADINRFAVIGDTVEFNVNSLIAEDQKTNLKINELKTFFRISQKAMEFSGLRLKTAKSFISDSVVFSYDKQSDLDQFNSNVKIFARLKNTKIHPDELALFAKGAEKISSPIFIDAVASGKVSNFRSKQFSIAWGNTRLQGTLEMDGLPELSETFINLRLRNSEAYLRDFSFALPPAALRQLVALGKLDLNGDFTGFPTDFVAKGNFSGSIGTIVSDINLKINENNPEKSFYTGALKLSDFNLGNFLNDTTTFQQVSLEGQVKGTGLTAKSADFTLKGTISKLGVLGYPYSNIQTNARLSSQFFNGFVLVRDPNLRAEVAGSVDFRNQRHLINVAGRIDSAYLMPLKLADQPVFVRTDFNVNVSGLQLDSLSGNASVQKFFIQMNNDSLSLDEATFESIRNKTNRSLQFKSSLVDAQLNGNFTFSYLFKDVETLIEEIGLNIKNDKNATRQYYQSKDKTAHNYRTNFEVSLKNLKPVFELLDVPADVSNHTIVEGAFISGPTSILQLYTTVDTLRYKQIQFYQSELDVSASKISDSTNVLAMATVSSTNQQISKSFKTKNFFSEVIWDKSQINFSADVEQQGQNNYARVRGEINFKDSTYIRLLPSEIKLLKDTWHVSEQNLITQRGKEWNFQSVTFYDSLKKIAINGAISENPDKKISLTIENFELATINELITEKLSGTLQAKITASEFYQSPSVENEIYLQNFSMNNFLIGNVTGNNIWDDVNKKFDVDFNIERNSQKAVSVTGYYQPRSKTTPLSLDATLKKVELKILEPFLRGIFSKMEGTVSGDFRIAGPLNGPDMTGSGQITQGRLMVDYLKTIYNFSGDVSLSRNSINFDDVRATDQKENSARARGKILHENFNKMSIDLGVDFENFQVLNTNAKDNDLFYGEGYASGNVRFTGPLNNMLITSTARSEKNTRIFIPIQGTSSVEKKDFINFVNFSDSTFTASLADNIVTRTKLTGITLDLNIDVTPDAYCEIIFDIKAGDIIRGRGDGDIKLQLDTKGEFNMFGYIEFQEGGYNFTLYDIINKEFSITKGSRISWFGDPYGATLNITASYNQIASLAPILSDPELANVTQIRRKYPVQVLLKLDGAMLSPAINFDIVANDLPKSIPVEGKAPVRLDFEFAAFKNKLDEQELKRQVFSLIVLRRFSPPESFNTSGSLVNSVSELFSNQLSYWASQVDENLEIDVDLGTLDQEAFNTFQLRLSYSFFNGRLRVTRDGALNSNPQQTNSAAPTDQRSNLSGVVGDWTVDYLLTNDGKFKVRMYSRTNVNPLYTSVGTQNAVTTGVSLTHTQSFNQIKDLWQSARKNKRKEEADPQNNKEATKEEDGSN